jgi:spore germination protein KC
LAIVAGFAIDKEDGQFMFSTEVIDIKSGGKEPQITSRVVSSTGPTIFEADRKIISIVGKKLYYNHAEVLVLSREIAEEGVAPVLDWVARDPETRYTLHLIVSEETTAKEILEKNPATDDINSYKMNDTLENEKYLSETPTLELWQFLTEISSHCQSGILPVVSLTPISNGVTQDLKGTALFKADKMVGMLESDETKTLMFILNKVKGGLLVNTEYENNTATKVTMEIFRNATKMEPSITGGRITIKITSNTEVSVAEIEGKINYNDPQKIIKLKQDFEQMLENKMVQLVKKVQTLYNTDVFGFGKVIKIKAPSLWKETIMPNWDQYFPTIQVETDVKITILNSGLLNEPVDFGG